MNSGTSQVKQASGAYRSHGLVTVAAYLRRASMVLRGTVYVSPAGAHFSASSAAPTEGIVRMRRRLAVDDSELSCILGWHLCPQDKVNQQERVLLAGGIL